MRHSTQTARSLCISSLVTCAAVLLGASPAQAGEYPFTNEVELTSSDVLTSGQPQWSDLDADGDSDLIIVSAGTLRWMENDGKVTNPFDEHVVEPEIEILAANVGDMDGDGDLDIVAVGDELRWYESIENGQAFVPHTIDPDSQGIDIDVGDIDADGDLDIAIADYDTGEPAWYENPGDPNNDWGSIHIIPSGLFYTDFVALGDFDGDGDADILASDEYTQHVSLLSYADGPWDETPQDGTRNISSIEVVDIDDDGDLDILTGGESTVVLMRNISEGIFGIETLRDTGSSAVSFKLSAGDVDADGDLDIVAVNYNGQPAVTWFDNNDGEFEEEHLISESFASGGGVSVADADCDGDAEIAVHGDAGGWSFTIFANETNDGECADTGGGDGGDGDGGDGDGGDADGGDADGGDADGGDADGGDADGGDTDGGDGGDGTGGGDDGGSDGSGDDGGSGGQNDDSAGGLCSVSRGQSLPLSGLALLMLGALGYRRRQD